MELFQPGWKKNGERCRRLMKDGIHGVGEGSKNEWKVFRMGSKIRKRWMCVPRCTAVALNENSGRLMDCSSRSNTFNLDFLLPSSISQNPRIESNYTIISLHSIRISTWPRSSIGTNWTNEPGPGSRSRGKTWEKIIIAGNFSRL